MGVEARMLRVNDRHEALAYLMREPRANLFLLDLAARLGGSSPPGEMSSEMAGAWAAGELVGVAALRPTVVLDFGVHPEAVEALLPYLDALGVGLIKSWTGAVDTVWAHLSRRSRRRALVDRMETAYSVRPAQARLVEERCDLVVRPARRGDLDALVIAARESLREEDRPDPFAGDVRGFRQWVRGRIPRARVIEVGGRIVFTGYADVRRKEGWLVQGVYTWPEERRRGFASLGVSALCREAFAAGAEHVQLAVVEGNAAGRGVYERLGFQAFGRLRTILFARP